MSDRTERRSELRQRLRLDRRQFDGALRLRAEAQLSEHLLRCPEVAAAGHLTAYRAIRGEVSIDGVIATMMGQGKTVSIPRVVGEHLEFVPCTDAQQTQPGSFGIAEPIGGEPIPFASHQVALVPLVAFDRSGRRLGQGGGFYDRAIAGATRPPFLVGVAFELQRVSEVPSEPWDMALDAVVTEAGFFRFSPPATELDRE